MENTELKRTQTNVTHHVGQTEIPDTINSQRIISKFNYSLENSLVDKVHLKKFIDGILEIAGPETKPYEFRINKNSNIYIENNDIFCDIDINDHDEFCKVSFYSKTLENYHKMFKVFKGCKFSTKTLLKVRLSEVYQNSGGLRSKDKIYGEEDLKRINEKYYPYINMDKFMDEFIQGEENVLILCGAPGTGKSKFSSLVLKKLTENKKYFDHFTEGTYKSTKGNSSNEIRMDEISMYLEEILEDNEGNVSPEGYENLFYNIVTAKNIDMISGDEFWNRIDDEDLIILDDLDFLLSSRKENREDTIKNQFLSNFLSFTDGIDFKKTKIIITTNQPFESIDEALLRRGRLFAILEFRGLTEDEALDVWLSEGLSEDSFNEFLKTLDSNKNDGLILHSDLGEGISNVKRNKKYLEKKDFILDENIDAIHKSKQRRVGLI